MVPKDVVTAFDEIKRAAQAGADDPPAGSMIAIAEGVVGALFSIAHSLERIATAGEALANMVDKRLPGRPLG